jgi:hypothetical protein
LSALLNLNAFYGDYFKVQRPTGSGTARPYTRSPKRSSAVGGTFLPDAAGNRPVYGATRKFQEDAHWLDLILLYEYFHGHNGAGFGASHQTGWTGTIALLVRFLRGIDAKSLPDSERERLESEIMRRQV